MIATLQSSLSITPASLSPAAWFRYGQGITSVAGAVSQWDDQSGNGRHLKQATGAAQPALQADSSILFNGTAQFMATDAFSGFSAFSLYLLFRQVTWAANDCITDVSGVGNNGVFQVISTPNIRAFCGSGGTLNPDLVVNTYGVLSWVVNGTSQSLQINSGTPVADTLSADPAAKITLGTPRAAASQFSNIQCKELPFFGSAHDAATRASVIAYLSRVGAL